MRPFPRPALCRLVRGTSVQLLAAGGRFGIQPAEDWPGAEPWTRADSLERLEPGGAGRASGRRCALLAALRRAATPAGALPERVDAETGIPRSTTPLAWSHAFAVLALQELWPRRCTAG